MRQFFGVAVAPPGNPRPPIVDESTAGLDPAGRARPLNLPGESGEQSVLLLPARIVEDVGERRTRIAIVDAGATPPEAEPPRAVGAPRGGIRRRLVAEGARPDPGRARAAIATKRFAGRTASHARRDGAPGPGVAHAEPDGEELSLGAMAGHIGRRRALSTAAARP